MTDGSHYAIAGVIAVIAAIFGLLRKKKSSAKKKISPPKNEAADVALDAIQESLEEEIDRIQSATTSDSPAEGLSDLGNARKRR